MRNVLFTLGMMLFLTNGFSQNNAKNDIIMTADGQLLQVKVTKVTDGTISFNYPGESVVNEIDTRGIEKIVFSSGRTQNFKGSSAPKKAVAVEGRTQAAEESQTVKEEVVVEPTDIFAAPEPEKASAAPVAPPAPPVPSFEKNSVAIVPLDFKRNGKYDKTLSSGATEFMVNLLSSKSNTSGISVLPTKEVVVKLVDGGFNYEKLRQASPKELRTLLGTEYLMYINIDENGSSSESSENAQMERAIRLKIYDANDDGEFYTVDFTEDMFSIKTDNNATSLASGKWKSSLRYLAKQLLESNTFAN